VVPVRSTGPIPRERLLEASRELAGLEVEGAHQGGGGCW
jgi:CxxC motif-containing protein